MRGDRGKQRATSNRVGGGSAKNMQGGPENMGVVTLLGQAWPAIPPVDPVIIYGENVTRTTANFH